MWKESSMERGYDCQGGSATVGRQRSPANGTLSSPFFSLSLPLPFLSWPSLLSHSLTLVIVWTWLSIALVPQEPVLFEMTISENIMWGTNRDIVSLEEIIEAATTANNQQVHLVAPEWLQHVWETRGASCLVGGNKELSSYVPLFFPLFSFVIFYFLFCILYFVFCILYFVFCILYFVFCILYFVFCILYFVFCILYFVFSIFYFLFSIFYFLFSIFYFLFSIFYLLSSIFYLLSSIFYLLSSISVY